MCLGYTKVGRRGLWRLVEPHVEQNSDPMFPVSPWDGRHASAFIGHAAGHSARAASTLTCCRRAAPCGFCAALGSPRPSYLHTFTPKTRAICSASLRQVAKHKVLSGEVSLVELPCETFVKENPKWVLSKFLKLCWRRLQTDNTDLCLHT